TLRAIAGGLEWEGAATQFALGSEWHAYQDAGRLLGELPGSTAIGVAAAGLGSSYDRALTREALAQQIAPSLTNFGSGGIGLPLFTFDGIGSVSEWEAQINEDARNLEAEWGVTRADVGELLNDGVVFAIDQDLGCDQYED